MLKGAAPELIFAETCGVLGAYEKSPEGSLEVSSHNTSLRIRENNLLFWSWHPVVLDWSL